MNSYDQETWFTFGLNSEMEVCFGFRDDFESVLSRFSIGFETVPSRHSSPCLYTVVYRFNFLNKTCVRVRRTLIGLRTNIKFIT